jgi:hypothetical protein
MSQKKQLIESVEEACTEGKSAFSALDRVIEDLKRKQEDLDERRLDFEKEVKKWRGEKENIEHHQQQTVKLSVGGQKFVTTIGTLSVDQNSMLAAMFSGRHPIVKDDEGYAFIDRDGELFKILLAFLRNPTGFQPPLDRSVCANLYKEACYFQLSVMGHARLVMSFALQQPKLKVFITHSNADMEDCRFGSPGFFEWQYKKFIVNREILPQERQSKEESFHFELTSKIHYGRPVFTCAIDLGPMSAFDFDQIPDNIKQSKRGMSLMSDRACNWNSGQGHADLVLFFCAGYWCVSFRSKHSENNGHHLILRKQCDSYHPLQAEANWECAYAPLTPTVLHAASDEVPTPAMKEVQLEINPMPAQHTDQLFQEDSKGRESIFAALKSWTHPLPELSLPDFHSQ